MDKEAALKLSRAYLKKVKDSEIEFTEAWLFGYYATGNQHDNSDIDIAIVLADSEMKSFETEVKLMVIRKGEETMIEPHTFTKDEFNIYTPIIDQIVNKGEKIKLYK